MKKPLIVFIVLALVLVVAVIARGRALRASDTAAEKAAAAQMFKAKFDAAAVSGISLSSATGTVDLAKQDGQWVVKGYYGGVAADAAFVADFLAVLGKLSGEKRSDDASLLKDYGLDKAGALMISLAAGGKDVEKILLGSKATAMGGRFICRDGSSGVYAVEAMDLSRFLVPGEHGKPLSIDPAMWAAKDLVRFDNYNVAGIMISDDGRNVLDVRKGTNGQWAFTGKVAPAIDPAKVDQYLQALAGIRVSGYTAPEDTKFSDKSWTLTLAMNEGPAIVIRRLKKEDGRTFAAVDGKPYAFTLDTGAYDSLSRGEADFFTSDILGLDPARVTQVAVNYPTFQRQDVIVRGEEKDKDGKVEILWKADKTAFKADKVAALLQAMKNLPLKGGAVWQDKAADLLSLEFTQEGKKSLLRVQGSAEGSAPGQKCYPVMVDDAKSNACLAESSLKIVTTAIDALYAQ